MVSANDLVKRYNVRISATEKEGLSQYISTDEILRMKLKSLDDGGKQAVWFAMKITPEYTEFKCVDYRDLHDTMQKKKYLAALKEDGYLITNYIG